MPVPPPPLRYRLHQRLSRRLFGRRNSSATSAVAGAAAAAGAGATAAMKPRRLSTSTPLLRGTPFLHRRPLFPLSPRTTSRTYSNHAGGGTGGGAGGAGAGTGGKRQSFSQRLREALSKTKIEWYPIPIGLGIGYLAFAQFRKVTKRKVVDEQTGEHGVFVEDGDRKRVRPDGPWQVQVLSTLPLKAVSRAWGYFNQFELPVFLRTPGFKLYSYIFGVNLDEIAESDLRKYRNLSEFFYRKLKPDVRPIDFNPAILVSPSDGRVLHFGEVRPGGHVEQVKGMTYSLDALLGSKSIGYDFPVSSAASGSSTPRSDKPEFTQPGVLHPDEEFAIVNGIHYTLPSLLHGPEDSANPPQKMTTEREVRDSLVEPPPAFASSSPRSPEDLSLPASELPTTSDVASMIREVSREWYHPSAARDDRKLFFCVIYLAPGDYHRFHSPTDWVVERRRHFVGELYSVSPYLQRTLPNLFTLNERVALLGRWRHGLFTMTPVGATNVGSIVINFDKELRTNSLTHDSKAAKQGGYYEAVYRKASALLGGHPVRKGAEMGGFMLGSTIVLVFEAPDGEAGKRFKWRCRRGGKVKFGEALGVVEGM